MSLDEEKNILNKLSEKEKIKLLRGKDFWSTFENERVGLSSVRFCDGPHGLRKQLGKEDNIGVNSSEKATCFPTGISLACSFDKDLMYKVGETLASECKDQGVDVILGPAINIKRSPLCGRNFEYLSEDPILSGYLSSAYIKGLQDKGIGTSIKHFACNSQETKRLISNSCLDERTLHEIYLKAFEIAIKEAKPWTVMSSYNMINGVYSSENPYLLKNILRKDWGFEGAVISDWGALNKESDSFKNGLNLEMPGLDNSRFKRLYKDLKKGNMTLEELDEACIPMIDLERKVKQGRQIKLDCDYSNNEQIAREVANNCAVLLKNEQNILPINKNQNVLFIGGFIFNPRYQGGGSSNITPYSLKLINDLIKIEFPNSEIEEGFSVEKDLDKNFDEEQINQIINKAKKAEKIVFLGGLPLSFESEGYDRKSMKIPENQIFMFNKLYEVNPNIVLVLQGGSPMEIPFIEKPKGILLQYLAGESVASSFIDLLTGVSNPSGRLAETWPIKESDNPLYGRYPENELNVLYTEGQYIGYRYYINKMINPLYPFGYGLSYTRFSYNDIKLNNNKLSFKVKNIGSTFGKEVIQIYVTSKDNEKKYSSLKDFTKISLNPNEEKEVVIEIKDDFFTYYDVSQKRFVKGSGQFEVSINKNACEVIQSFILDIDGENKYELPKDQILLTDLKPMDKKNNQKKYYDYNSTLTDLNNSSLGRFINRLVMKFIKKYKKNNPGMEEMVDMLLYESPLRFLVIGSDGSFTYSKLDGLLLMLNGKFFKGLFKLLF